MGVYGLAPGPPGFGNPPDRLVSGEIDPEGREDMVMESFLLKADPLAV